jgi:hypothetical protein
MGEKIFIPGAVDAIMHVETDGEIHVEHVQDVEPILDYTHAARNHRFDANSPEGFVQHYAEVPAVILMEWAREAGVGIFSNEMSVIMEKKLRDPANAKFLAAPKVRDPRVIMKGLR